MRIWISGGGTAGHVYPALTVLDALAAPAQVAWLGTADSMEASIAARRGIPFLAVPSGPVVGVGPRGLLRSAWRIAVGTLTTWRRLRASRVESPTSGDGGALDARPDVIFVTGGYVCVPVALAARLAGVPLVVFLPDVMPGKAVQLVARLADRVAASHPAALRRLPPDRTVVTGYPVRKTVRVAARAPSRARLGLAAEGRVLLVFGGSQGARRLNLAVAQAAPALLARMEVVHVVGSRHLAAALAAADALPDALRPRYHVFDYLQDEDMAAAFAAADLVVSRAGASCLGEYPAAGLPSILVPLPISGGHQWPNARVLEEAGAAVVVADGEMDGGRLAREVGRLLDDPATLGRMSQAARALDQPHAAAAIAGEITRLARRNRREEFAA